MKFLWPEMLGLLVLVPLLVGLYVWLLRRRKKAARALREPVARQGGDWVAGQAGAGTCRLLLFLLALTALFVAVARPTAVITLPSQHETIILAMDVSGSMRATDVEPNRLTASQVAAKAFVAEQPRNARIGVVSFAGTAALVQPPTQNREDIVAAIDRFQLQRGTAIGSGIIVSLAAIFPDAGIDLGNLTYGREAAQHVDRPEEGQGQAAVQAGAAGLVRLGRHHPAHRRPDARPAPTRSRPRRWPPSAACACSPWASARRRARSSASKAGRCACGSTRIR